MASCNVVIGEIFAGEKIVGRNQYIYLFCKFFICTNKGNYFYLSFVFTWNDHKDFLRDLAGLRLQV